MIHFTPGPTQLHPCVRPAITRAFDTDVCSLSHRSAEFQAIYARADAGVRSVMGLPDDWHVFFIGSATQGMERILQNGVSKKSHHFVNGAFSERMYKTAKQLHLDATAEVVSQGQGFDIDQLSVPDGVELVSYALNETSTGVWSGVEMAARLRSAFPDALISLDAVSAVPYATIDFSQIDVTFFSIQKGFGLPAGLGVMLVSPRAYRRAADKLARGESIGSYHSYLSMAESAKKRYTVETPNVLALYLLGEVCDALLTEGVDVVRKKTEAKAERIYDWVRESGYDCFVEEPSLRSPTVSVIATDEVAKVHEKAESAGFVLGAGYGQLKDSTFRIANFPMHTREDLEQVLTILQAQAGR